jgi:L-fuconolactonase
LKRYPDLNLVIDHGAKPGIEHSSTPQWFEKTALIASETSAFCKLSGLVTEAGVNPSSEQLIPYMKHLLDCFGADRLMWGSDWPVVGMSSNYQSWLGQAEEFLIPLSSSEQHSIWATNAQRFYKL